MQDVVTSSDFSHEPAPSLARSGGLAPLRLVVAELDRDSASGVRARVVLAAAGRVASGESEGVGCEGVELRIAAEATLAAIQEATQGDPEFRLVGIKRFQAFDTQVVVAALSNGDRSAAPRIGAVPVRGDLARAVALAVLDAAGLVDGSQA